MKKIIIYTDDNKAELLTEMLEHLDLVKSMEIENVTEARIYPGGNFEIKSGKGQAGTKDIKEQYQTAGQDKSGEMDVIKGSKNIRQLRDALSAIDNIRDKNKKRFTS